MTRQFRADWSVLFWLLIGCGGRGHLTEATHSGLEEGPPLSLFVYAPNSPGDQGARKREAPVGPFPENLRNPSPISHFENFVTSPKPNFELIKNKMSKPIVRLTKGGKMIPEQVPGFLVEAKDASKVFVPNELLANTRSLLTKGPSEFERLVDPDQSSSKPVRRQVTGTMMPGMPFSFQYIVDDERTKNFQTRYERGDVHGVVRGCYQILEPGGLIRTVTYQADKNGFRVLSVTKEEDKIPCSGFTGESGTLSGQGNFGSGGKSSHLLNQKGNSAISENKVLQKAFGNQRINQNTAANHVNSKQNTVQSSKSLESQGYQQNYQSQSNRNLQQSQLLSNSNAAVSQKESANVVLQAHSNQKDLSYEKEFSGSNQWMSEYLNSLNELVTKAFTDVSTVTTGEDGTGQFVNFPFVLIPITTYLQLRQKGLIDQNVQGFGAVVQPIQAPSQPQATYLEKGKQSVQTVVRTYNTTESKSQQKSGSRKAVKNYNFKVSGGRSQDYGPSNGVSQLNPQVRKSVKKTKSSAVSSSNLAQNSRQYLSQQNGIGNGNLNSLPKIGSNHRIQNAQFKTTKTSHQSSQSSKSQKSTSTSNFLSKTNQNPGNLGGNYNQFPQNRINQINTASPNNYVQNSLSYLPPKLDNPSPSRAPSAQNIQVVASKSSQQSSQKSQSSATYSSNISQNSNKYVPRSINQKDSLHALNVTPTPRRVFPQINLNPASQKFVPKISNLQLQTKLANEDYGLKSNQIPSIGNLHQVQNQRQANSGKENKRVVQVVRNVNPTISQVLKPEQGNPAKTKNTNPQKSQSEFSKVTTYRPNTGVRVPVRHILKTPPGKVLRSEDQGTTVEERYYFAAPPSNKVLDKRKTEAAVAEVRPLRRLPREGNFDQARLKDGGLQDFALPCSKETSVRIPIAKGKNMEGWTPL